ncbi:MAG: tetratricopeptide repeat protein [Phycisphaerae bacterium]
MLIAVQLLIAIHVVHWLAAGSTLTPVEPSEAMEFSKYGVVNAGAIFFALAILSTLILGRWICGWACHLVALQDLSRWLLARVGMRPRPLRSSLLGLVPLIAFLYMFVAPPVYRALGHASPMHLATNFYTEEFWATFPTWTPAILTLVICGGVIIYFLGAKGFCTNACPYGAVFGVADQFAPLRVRVTDDCRQSGHCTSVCTSNVRVHEEVREFRMVVDPGCMKCLDCVSVCPNDALFVGIGPPAIGLSVSPGSVRPPSRTEGSETSSDRPTSLTEASESSSVRPPSRTPPNGAHSRIARLALRAMFLFASFMVFGAYDRAFDMRPEDWIVAAVLTGVSVLVVLLFSGRTQPRRAHGLWEEALMGIVFLAAMLAFRGIYGMVAFLFALGIGAILAYLVLQAVLAIVRENFTFHGWRIRRAGRFQPAAAGLFLSVLAIAALGAHSGWIQYHSAALRQVQTQLDATRASSLSNGTAGAPASAALRELAQRGLAHAASLERFGLLADPLATRHAPMMHLLAGDAPEFEQRTLKLITGHPKIDALWTELGGFYVQSQRLDDAIALYQRWTQSRPGVAHSWLNLGLCYTIAGRFNEGRAAYDEAQRLHPHDALLEQNYGILEAEAGDMPAALRHFERAVELAPSLPAARLTLGRALVESGRAADALRHLQTAIDLAPSDPDGYLYLAQAQAAGGDLPAARRTLESGLAKARETSGIFGTLVEVCNGLGDAAAAERYRRQALQSEPRP